MPPPVVEREGEKIYFCSTHCRDNFVAGPAEKENARSTSCCHGGDASSAERNRRRAAAARKPASKYFCPMCEGVESDTPGQLSEMRDGAGAQPGLPRKGEDDLHLPDASPDRAGSSGRLPDLRDGARAEKRRRGRGRRERRAARHDAPLLDRRRPQPAGFHSRDVAPSALACRSGCRAIYSRWAQFILSTPVVLWAGWPFFQRGWRSLVNRSLNMFTLIAIGVGAAYFYSAVVMLLPQLFPPSFAAHGKIGVYFEAAAIITVLVLLGQVLEGRARSRTGQRDPRPARSRPDDRAGGARWRGEGCPARRSAAGRSIAGAARRKSPGRRPGNRWPNEHR